MTTDIGISFKTISDVSGGEYMAYGYIRGFVIESDDTGRKKVNCKDCYFYNSEDKSCMKRSFYMPEDGYKHWKTCKFFALDKNTPNYEYKLKQVIKIKK